MSKTPRKPKLNLSVFRPRDLFRVKTPVITTRWGYPLSHRDASKHVAATLEDEIKALFSKLGAQIDAEQTAEDMKNVGLIRFAAAKAEISHWDMKRVVSGLASHWLKLQGFGGNTRSLHTREEPALKDVECQVVGRKIVKTGTRYAPWSSGPDYNGEYDYEPGGLENEQTHVLLQFYPTCGLDQIASTQLDSEELYLWIEAKNVVKIYDSATNQRIDPVTQKPLDKNTGSWQSIPTYEQIHSETTALSDFVNRHFPRA